jgi:gluconate kinase
MSQNAGRNLERQLRAGLSKVLDDLEQTKASWKIACSLRLDAGRPPWLSAIQMLICQSERRRIVALVRREALKNQDFFALRNSADHATFC